MTNELRGIVVEDIEELGKNEIIGVGSEGCVHDCINKFKALMDLSPKHDKTKISFRLITPRIPEKYMDVMLRWIKRLTSELNVHSIVINDYGLLYKINKENFIFCNIILGRTLIRTLEDIPWNDLIIESESKEMKQAIVRSNIMHLEKINLFKSYNVSGVELSPVKSNERIIDELHKCGLQCFIHYNNEIATIGRTCPRLRIANFKGEKCFLECDKVIIMELVNPYGAYEYSGELQNIYPTLYNVNNVIYHKKNIYDKFEYQNSDGIIFDYRLCDRRDIDIKRKLIQGEGSDEE